MNRKGGSKSNLFLTELIIGILFFALTSAICVQLFAQARTTAVKSSDLSFAVGKAQNAAEAFKAFGADAEQIAGLIHGKASQDRVLVYYNSAWDETGEAEEAIYSLALDWRQEGTLLQGTAAVYKGEDKLYSLDVGLYQPSERE